VLVELCVVQPGFYLGCCLAVGTLPFATPLWPRRNHATDRHLLPTGI